MRLSSIGLVAPVALVCAGAPACAEEQRKIDLPSGRLSDRVPQLARQTGISISVTSDMLWRARVRGVRGTMSAGEALARMLAGTNSRAVQLSATSWRIDAVMPSAQEVRVRKHRPAPQPLPTVDNDDGEAIIVTASKLDQPYSDFPGTVHMLDGRDLNFGGERGTEAVLSRLASVASTHLGPGRNKLFIRGIADSSFTGPTQATVGQYYGDLRLSYNAPDPDLRLHDIKQVEVLEGSQGTLYGAGSLGGIIRMVPNDPDPRGFMLQTEAGVSATQHGAPGGDLAATVNLPFGDGRHAARFTAYGISEGGYIDNPLRGENDVNRSRIAGGRGDVRFDLGNAWTLDVGGIYQSTVIDDSQYADRGGPPLTRSSPVVEGSDAHYGMATIVVRKDWGDIKFQTSNAYVNHVLDEHFNATKPGDAPNLFEQRNRTHMWVNETRLWHPVEDGLGWVLGFSAIDNNTVQKRSFEQGRTRATTTGVTNTVTEFTAYGKLSIELLPSILLSGGGRLTHSRLGGMAEDVQPFFRAAGIDITAERQETQLLPSAELLARVAPDVTLYVRYEEGFRPGGLAIEGMFVRQFRNDHVESWEGGARWSDPQRGVAASLSLAHAYWRDIQADFIDGNGLPSTANIGDGRITSIAGSITFYPSDDLKIELNAVYNHSKVLALSPEIARLPYFATFALPVTGPSFGMPALGTIGTFGPTAALGRIPNVADYAMQGSIDYRVPMGGANDLRLNAWFKYLGPSRLGIGPKLGDEQGDYVDTGATARWGNDRRGVSVTLTNLLDTKGNQFALGTPFETSSGGFVTPQRPRTIRIALDYRY
ncbi:TonB-dependent receptor plug domain-containing protein [Sphingobium sp. H33]|uniref:TonB-dependent receptor plug domain-containing protein n=2 Tax=Sphingobium nicotianae TaxID=2782607 RepID=A0A9X1DDC9_9SPHN|nr:TonB-dependent receptor plug domain-containing protein [Sphingobium nicotianae]MBT2187820.1 TonB-dependent receptor plug domain-containing protein [Sphingobium nicotianae]